jgi:raffinose/stachyose/melibiose transport system permease protein
MSNLADVAAPAQVAGAATAASKRSRNAYRRRSAMTGWLYALPALVMFAFFDVYPILTSVQYSFFDWNGITPAEWVGLGNYVEVFTTPKYLGSIWHSVYFILWFTIVPTCVGLVVASVMRDIQNKYVGTVARTMMFLPQIIPGAASAVAWVWMYSDNGLVNQFLGAIGLESTTRAWLGDFSWALTAVGFIGTWLSVGFCTLLLMSGIGKIDSALYEAASLDGANWWQQQRAVTFPGLRSELGVCVTITVIAALASFDVVFMSTGGGPGTTTMVPGVQIYVLAFTETKLGLASAVAVVLALIVIAVILPLQRLFRER